MISDTLLLARHACGGEWCPQPVSLEPRDFELKPYERPLDNVKVLQIVPCIFDRCGLSGFTGLLNSLQRLREPISLEVIANKNSIFHQTVCQEHDLPIVKGAIQAHLTYGYFVEQAPLMDPFYSYVMSALRASGRPPGFYFMTAKLPGQY